jgi:hypothetical protein
MNQIEFENLVETRKKLLDEITSLSYEELNEKPKVKSWSVAQVYHHLSLVENLFAKAIRYGLKQTDVQRMKPKPIHRVSDRTMKLNAPEMSIPGEVPLDALQIIELLNESRTKLLDVINRITDTSILTERSAKHPLFGELPLNQWVDLVYLHEQRHIEQIKEIKLLIQ